MSGKSKTILIASKKEEIPLPVTQEVVPTDLVKQYSVGKSRLPAEDEFIHRRRVGPATLSRYNAAFFCTKLKYSNVVCVYNLL